MLLQVLIKRDSTPCEQVLLIAAKKKLIFKILLQILSEGGYDREWNCLKSGIDGTRFISLAQVVLKTASKDH